MNIMDDNKENIQQQQLQQQQLQLPFGCFSNLAQIGDPVHEIPLPCYRNDRSVSMQLQDTLVLNNTLELLQQQQQQYHQQQDNNNNNIFQDINNRITHTNVDYISMKNNINYNFTHPTPVLNSILQQLPSITLQQQQYNYQQHLLLQQQQQQQLQQQQQQQLHLQQQQNNNGLLNIPHNPSNIYVSNDHPFLQNTLFQQSYQQTYQHPNYQFESYLNDVTVANGVANATTATAPANAASTKKSSAPKKPRKLQNGGVKSAVSKDRDIESAQAPLDQHIQEQLESIVSRQLAAPPAVPPIEKFQAAIQQFIDQFVDIAKDNAAKSVAVLDGVIAHVSLLRSDLASMVSHSLIQLQDLIPLEHYANLFQLLLKYVRDARDIHSVTFSEKSSEKELAEFRRLELSFESTILILQILTIPIVGLSLCELIDDELIELLSFFKAQYCENILGHLDPSFKTRFNTPTPAAGAKDKSTKKKESTNHLPKSQENEDEEEDEEEESDDDSDSDDSNDDNSEEENNSSTKNKNKKKQKTSSTSSSKKLKTSTLKYKKRGHNYYLYICNKVTEIFNGLAELVMVYTPPDPFPMMLVDISVPPLFIGGINFIQMSAIELLRSTYCCYPSTGDSIFEQTLSNLSKTPALKKNLRTYKLKDHRSIQNITALFLQLIQSSQSLPEIRDESQMLMSVTANSSSSLPMKQCHDNASMVVLYFINKCSTKSEDCEYRTILDNFLADLLVLVNNPEWPAANMLLHLLSVSLCRILSDKSKSGSSDILKMMAIDLLGQIITKLKQECMASNDELASLPLHFSDLMSLVTISQDNAQTSVSAEQTATEKKNNESLITDVELAEELDKKYADRLKNIHQQQSSVNITATSSVIDGSKLPVCQCGQFKIGSFTIKCANCHYSHHDLCAPDFSLDQHHQQREWLCISCRILSQVNGYQPPSSSQSITITDKPTKPKMPLSKRKKMNIIPEDEDVEDSFSILKTTTTSSTSVLNEKEERPKKYVPPPANSDYNVLIHLMLNYLNSKAQSERWLTCSKRFLIASWLDSDFLSSKLTLLSKQYVLSQWDNSQDAKCYTVGTETAAKLFRVLSIHTKGSLFNIVNELLYNLLSVLYDTSKIARAKAMKSFSTIVEVDPSVLADEFVHTSIRNRFTDDSIAVREHTVDLIGKYILLKPDLTWKYIDHICELIADKGISVRKRVVKTLHDVCLAQIQHPKIPQLCKVLVSRIGDEESIKELVINTFKDLWFGEHEQTIVQKSKQIVEVVKQLNQDEWFVGLIHKLTDKGKVTKRTTKQQKSAEAITETCQQICSYLIDMLISFDEKRRTKEFPEFLAIFKCLRIFCKIDPTFLTTYVKVLHPYIKLSTKTINGEELKIFVIITYILQKTIPMIENIDKQFLAVLEKDLLTLILTQGSVLVHQCIKCLSVIIESTSHNYKLIEMQLCKHLVLLQSCSNRTKSEILRSLYVAGLLVRYYDFEKRPFTIDLPPSLKFGGGSSSSSVVSEITAIITKLFLFTKDKDVISTSLESIGNIIISSPPILNQESIRNIITRSLSAETKIKETILKVYLKLLKKEAKTLIKNAPKGSSAEEQAKSESEESATDHSGVSENDDNDDEEDNKSKLKKNKKRGPIISMNVDINGESLVASIQKFFSTFTKLLVDPEQTVRLYTISTVELIVKQGIINPLEAVPEIITLVTDPNTEISEIAYRVLEFINQKHSSTLFKRVIESIRLCYRFHLSLGTKSPYNSVSKGLSRFYLLFRNLKQSRTTFINHIMSQFENTNRTYRYKNLEYFRFLVEILASLPYSNMDEIFEIVVAIDKIVSLQGSSCMADIQSAMTKRKKNSGDDSELDENIKSLFIASLIVTLLVELKRYLIKTYDVTKERAKAYLEDGKNSDKLQITLPETLTFTKSNYPFTVLPTEDELSQDETQKKVFLAFKLLLKDDNVDYSTITTTNANEKKKAAAGKKRKTTTTTTRKKASTKNT